MTETSSATTSRSRTRVTSALLAAAGLTVAGGLTALALDRDPERPSGGRQLAGPGCVPPSVVAEGAVGDELKNFSGSVGSPTQVSVVALDEPAQINSLKVVLAVPDADADAGQLTGQPVDSVLRSVNVIDSQLFSAPTGPVSASLTPKAVGTFPVDVVIAYTQSSDCGAPTGDGTDVTGTATVQVGILTVP